MVTESQKQVLRHAMREQKQMAKWKQQASEFGFGDPDSWANARAWDALSLFAQTLEGNSLGGAQLDLLQVAYEVLVLVSEASIEQTGLNKRTVSKQGPPSHNTLSKHKSVKPQPRYSGSKKQAPKSKLKRPRRAEIARSTSEPFRRNYNTGEEPKSGKGKGTFVAARIETPSYARFVDEGIGGTREQVLDERRKLKRETKYRR